MDRFWNNTFFANGFFAAVVAVMYTVFQIPPTVLGLALGGLTLMVGAAVYELVIKKDSND